MLKVRYEEAKKCMATEYHITALFFSFLTYKLLVTNGALESQIGS